MKLRYRITADLYVPQYYIPSKNEWKDFTVKEVKHIPTFERLCKAMGDIQLPKRWEDGQWYFAPSDKEDVENMSVFFTKEMFVMAFLGAAKAIFDTQPKEFEL